MNGTISDTRSPLPSPFDEVASSYDDEFENNLVTQHLRNFLWHRMLLYFKSGQKVLDVNCGTGTDALFLAKNGIQVTCTDSSSAMISLVKRKAEKYGLQSRISAHIVPIEQIDSLSTEKYDGVISNFGGLNCVENLENSLDKISKVIKPKSVFIACLINKVCLWEILSFTLRGKMKSAFRRITKKQTYAPVGNQLLKVWYYTPSEFTKLSSAWFTPNVVCGLSILSPNPNSKNFISRHPKLTKKLCTLDESICYTFPFHSLGDHFVIELERNSN